MLFKIAAVPFTFLGSDVYEGSPALTTALMSTLAKVVSMATLFKLLTVVNADLSPSFQTGGCFNSSMTVGNIMALRQVNVKECWHFQVYPMLVSC
jgi:NADH-quinone oxidoreductase subunit N